MKVKVLILICFLLALHTVTKAQNKEMFFDIPVVSYCELVNNAEKFDQKFVRVKAIYSRGFESSIFYDESCENNKVSWVNLNAGYEKNTDSYLLKRFRKMIKGSNREKPREFELSMVGKFDGKRQASTLKTPAKTFTFSVGYGHLDAFDYQLTVLKIEEVKKIQ
jgi:hypothetical protein